MLSNVTSSQGQSAQISKDLLLNQKQTKTSPKSPELVKKGEVGYLQGMDSDNDGVVTMEEFNEYCAQNGISEKEKLALMQVIMNAKMAQKVNENTQKASKEINKKEDENENIDEEDSSKIVYAKKGDDKYNKEMDLNSDDKVTYEEYLRYCQQNAKPKEDTKETKSKDFNTNQALKAYSDKPTKEEEYSVEIES